MHIALPVAERVALQLAQRGLSVVAEILADNVRDDFAAVVAPPHRRTIWEFRHGSPRHLGGEEILHAGLTHELGQATRVTEHIRQPEQPRRFPATQPGERLLPEQETAGERLAARRQRVGLDLHGTGSFPAFLADAMQHAPVERGGTPAHGGVARGLTVGEAELRIHVDRPIGRGETVDSLRLPDPFRPEPDEINVSMPSQHGVKRLRVRSQLSVGNAELFSTASGPPVSSASTASSSKRSSRR